MSTAYGRKRPHMCVLDHADADYIVKLFLRRLFGLDYADHISLPKQTRTGLTYFYRDAVFAFFSDASSANYINLFLVSLKASNTQIGFLTTFVQILTALAPLPRATIAERTSRYRANILAPAFVARIGWFALALLPFLSLGPAAVTAAITIFGARIFLMAWLSAPWTAFVGRLVPAYVSYMATRNFGGGLATTPTMGIPIVILAGSLWSGHELSSFNTLLTVTPENGRANFIALHMFAISLFAAVGPAIGDALVDTIGFFPFFAVSVTLRLAVGILQNVLTRPNPS